MSPELLTFLKENNCKVLIKYDGVRDCNRYTVRLLYGDSTRVSLGRDTDRPFDVMREILDSQESFLVEEVMELLSAILELCVKTVRLNFGDGCVTSVMLSETDNAAEYNYHLQAGTVSKHASVLSFEDLISIMSDK